jgi:hypothetical protein
MSLNSFSNTDIVSQLGLFSASGQQNVDEVSQDCTRSTVSKVSQQRSKPDKPEFSGFQLPVPLVLAGFACAKRP